MEKFSLLVETLISRKKKEGTNGIIKCVGGKVYISDLSLMTAYFEDTYGQRLYVEDDIVSELAEDIDEEDIEDISNFSFE